VARLIALAVIGLGLDDHPGFLAAIGKTPDEVFAEQPARERHRLFSGEQFSFDRRSHLASFDPPDL
jgi:hypothetical protein